MGSSVLAGRATALAAGDLLVLDAGDLTASAKGPAEASELAGRFEALQAIDFIALASAVPAASEGVTRVVAPLDTVVAVVDFTLAPDQAHVVATVVDRHSWTVVERVVSDALVGPDGLVSATAEGSQARTEYEGYGQARPAGCTGTCVAAGTAVGLLGTITCAVAAAGLVVLTCGLIFAVFGQAGGVICGSQCHHTQSIWAESFTCNGDFCVIEASVNTGGEPIYRIGSQVAWYYPPFASGSINGGGRIEWTESEDWPSTDIRAGSFEYLQYSHRQVSDHPGFTRCANRANWSVSVSFLSGRFKATGTKTTPLTGANSNRTDCPGYRLLSP